jgi:hypothetical protein
MRLGGHRPGSLTVFVDTASNEALLEIGADEDGAPVVAFRLYDAAGRLVSESRERRGFPEGLQVMGASGAGESMELLLLLPRTAAENIQYRLYNSAGRLLAASDGSRTQIYGNLRMDSPKPGAERKTNQPS